MSYDILKKVGFGKLNPTFMSIQLAERSIVHSKGIIEVVIVKLGSLVFLVDFLILYIDYDADLSLIFGRPFLATAKALVDVNDGKLILRVGDDQIIFKISESMKQSSTHDDLYTCLMHVLNFDASNVDMDVYGGDPLSDCLM
ncbi:unnamed protein product [Linum trigynum]|uniref:Uncharacterized protein n=1 Tax=Linum trigynum TaxID=586398 RepID=A0AAV2EVP3_9ROSI